MNDICSMELEFTDNSDWVVIPGEQIADFSYVRAATFSTEEGYGELTELKLTLCRDIASAAGSFEGEWQQSEYPDFLSRLAQGDVVSLHLNLPEDAMSVFHSPGRFQSPDDCRNLCQSLTRDEEDRPVFTIRCEGAEEAGGLREEGYGSALLAMDITFENLDWILIPAEQIAELRYTRRASAAGGYTELVEAELKLRKDIELAAESFQGDWLHESWPDFLSRLSQSDITQLHAYLENDELSHFNLPWTDYPDDEYRNLCQSLKRDEAGNLVITLRREGLA